MKKTSWSCGIVGLAVQTLLDPTEAVQLDPSASGPILCWHHNIDAKSVGTNDLE